MKKMKFLAAAACLPLMFAACKKKDKDNDYKAAIVGKWLKVEDVATANVGGASQVNTYTKGEYERYTATDTLYMGSNNTTSIDTFFYKVDGDKLTIASDKALTKDKETSTIDELSGSTFSYSAADVELTAGVKVKLTAKLKK